MSIFEAIVGVGDMVLLDPMTEENLLENIRKRFDAGDIYVCQATYCETRPCYSHKTEYWYVKHLSR